MDGSKAREVNALYLTRGAGIGMYDSAEVQTNKWLSLEILRGVYRGWNRDKKKGHFRE